MKTKFFYAFIFFNLLAFITSCSTDGNKYNLLTAWRIHRATIKLNAVENSQNDWGKIAISDLNFVPNKGQFDVNFNEDASNYVADARNNVSGSASSSMQTAYYLSAALQGMFAPPVAVGQPAGSTNLPSPGSLPTQAATAVNGFSAPPSLGANPMADERDAVEKGISDELAQKFLELIANPDVDSNQQAVVFGVMQATCQPGEFTRKGFIAELDVSLRYGRLAFIKKYTKNPKNVKPLEPAGLDVDTGELLYTNGANLSPTTNFTSGEKEYLVPTTPTYQVRRLLRPEVLAVLPLMDSRNMELQNNNESQIEVALALSAAFAAKGMNAAANILSDYVKRQQSNIQTLNSLPVTTTYSDGPNFGFQVYPAAQAIGNPGGADSAAANVLQPVTFPIVVAMKVEQKQIDPSPGDPNTNHWNFLVTETQTRWIPINFFFRSWPWLWIDNLFFVSSAGTIGYGDPLLERMKRAREIDAAEKKLQIIAPRGAEYPQTVPTRFSYQYTELQTALDSLKTSILGGEVGHPLPNESELFPPPSPQPDANIPAITDVFPHTIWRDTNTDFLLLVKGVKDPSDVANVNIAGYTCVNPVADPYGTNSYTYSMKAANAPATLTNIVVMTNFVPQGLIIKATLPNVFYSVTNGATNNVDFVVSFNREPPATKTIGMLLQGRTPPQATVAISRDSNGKLLGINIQPGQDITSTNLLEAVTRILQKSETPPKSTTVVP